MTIRPFLRTLILVASATLPFVAAAPVAAHDAPGSTDFPLLVPNDPLNSSIIFVSLIGPASGEEVLHATWELTFVSPPGGTPAADVILELTLPMAGGSAEWAVKGSDLGWPAANGTFNGTLASDQLNGVLAMGPFGFTVPELVVLSENGGVTGQFVHSRITLELAGECQADLGFAGPGAVHLEVCGDELSSGGSAVLSVTGAAPFATMLLVVGTQLAPTPFKGGLLVPVPVLFAVPASAGSQGSLELSVPGGGGALTAYVQAIIADGAQPQGAAISNAVQLDLLP